MGVPLFVRHPRGMELTEAGEALLQEAGQVLASSERLEAAVEELGRRHTTGIAWRPLSDVQIEIRTAAAWRSANRSPLLRSLVDVLPAAAAVANVSESCRSSRSTPPTAQ